MDLGDRPRDIFVAETEKEAKGLVGLVMKHEVEKGIELCEGEVCLNCVFYQMGLLYDVHKARPKRPKAKRTDLTSMGVATRS